MQAQVRMKLVNRFKDRLKEGSVVTLEGYSLGEIQLKFHMVNKALRLSFLSSTKVEPCPDFSDVIGHVIACEDLDMGNELQCTLWSKICVQNGYNATKLFLFDATQPIVNEEFQDVKEYSSRFFAREDGEHNDQLPTEITALIDTEAINSTLPNITSLGVAHSNKKERVSTIFKSTTNQDDDYCPKKVLIPIVDTSKVITPNVVNTCTIPTPSVEKTNDGFQTVGKKKKKKAKSKSNNGGQFVGPSTKQNVRYEPKASTSAPKKVVTNVGNASNSSSLLKNTVNSPNQDNITSSNSFAALNEDVEEEEVENVFDEMANLFNSKSGGRSSFTAAVG
ncbi:zinc knuckle CX2CX4HX4C containing protein [Tanacetum coccineum]